MKKPKKIGLLVMPIVILAVMFLFLFQSDHTITLESKDNLNIISSETSEDTLFSFTSPVVGFSDSPVTIFGFIDYQCKECKIWYENEFPEISKNLIETKKTNIVFIDSVPLGNDSILISEATFCANDQNKYLDYQKLLFESQQEIDTWGKSEHLIQLATKLDMELDSFEKCLNSRNYENKVLSNIEISKNLGVSSIPIFKLVNYDGREHVLKGGIPSAVFEATVNQLQ